MEKANLLWNMRTYEALLVKLHNTIVFHWMLIIPEILKCFPFYYKFKGIYFIIINLFHFIFFVLNFLSFIIVFKLRIKFIFLFNFKTFFHFVLKFTLRCACKWFSSFFFFIFFFYFYKFKRICFILSNLLLLYQLFWKWIYVWLRKCSVFFFYILSWKVLTFNKIHQFI